MCIGIGRKESEFTFLRGIMQELEEREYTARKERVCVIVYKGMICISLTEEANKKFDFNLSIQEKAISFSRNDFSLFYLYFGFPLMDETNTKPQRELSIFSSENSLLKINKIRFIGHGAKFKISQKRFYQEVHKDECLHHHRSAGQPAIQTKVTKRDGQPSQQPSQQPSRTK